MEKMRVECPNCEASFKAPAEAAGRRAKCPKCAHVFVLQSDPDIYELAEALESGGVALPTEQPPAAAAIAQPASKPRGEKVPGPQACPNCGQPQAPDAVVCSACGSAVSAFGLPWSHPSVPTGSGERYRPETTSSRAFGILAVAAFSCCALGVIGWLLGTFGPWPSLLPLGYLLFVSLVVGIVAGIVGRKAPKRNAYAVLAQGAIVGSIICILLSILLPSLASAREYAKRAVCKANLRGIGQACCVYAKQNGGEFPPDLETLVELGLCTDKQFHCPSAREHPGDLHGSYEYIAGQRLGGDLRNVVAYDKPANHTGKEEDEEDTYCGGNVLFVNGYVEFFKPYARVRELVDQTRRRLGLGPLKRGVAASPAGSGGSAHPKRGSGRSARSRTPKREKVVPVVTEGKVYVNASLPLHFHWTPFCPGLLDAPVETWTTQELREIGTRGCDTCGWLGYRGCSQVLEMQVADLLRQTAEWSAAAKRSTDDTGRDLFVGDWGDVLVEETADGLRARMPGWGKPAKCVLTGKALVAITVDRLRYRRAQIYRIDDTLCVHARTVYCDQYTQGRHLLLRPLNIELVYMAA